MPAISNKGAFGVVDQGDSMRPLPRPSDAPAVPSVVPTLTREVAGRLESLGMPKEAPQKPAGGLSGLAALSRRAGQRTPPEAAPVAPVKGEFVPGKRPEPTGPRAHELWSNPETRAKLADVVKKWENANPGRKLKATHLVSAWNAEHPQSPLNEARARTLKARIERARQDYLVSQVAGYLSSGAKKAVLK